MTGQVQLSALAAAVVGVAIRTGAESGTRLLRRQALVASRAVALQMTLYGRWRLLSGCCSALFLSGRPPSWIGINISQAKVLVGITDNNGFATTWTGLERTHRVPCWCARFGHARLSGGRHVTKGVYGRGWWCEGTCTKHAGQVKKNETERLGTSKGPFCNAAAVRTWLKSCK